MCVTVHLTHIKGFAFCFITSVIAFHEQYNSARTVSSGGLVTMCLLLCVYVTNIAFNQTNSLTLTGGVRMSETICFLRLI